MTIIMDIKLKLMDDTRCKASLHLDFAGGSFTLSNILIRRKEDGGHVITFPLVQIGGNKQPAITMQGALKQAVLEALSSTHQRLLASGERTRMESRYFDDAFQALEATPPQATPSNADI